LDRLTKRGGFRQDRRKWQPRWCGAPGSSVADGSKHVQALENWLGVKLLNRSTRHVALTEAGEAFYERCMRILSDVEDDVVKLPLAGAAV
jgi:hypothetical protein